MAARYPVQFGKYLLLERINVGGMAEVFKAKTFGVAGFEKLVAIKRILPTMVEDEEFIRMFIDEARISVQLNHANIVQIYELGRHVDSYYIAMEYLPSRDLRTMLDRLRQSGTLMPIPQAAYVATKVCEALDYAHRKKDAFGKPLHLIHRDVSPQNVLVGYEGEVKVIDFGIAKAAGRASKTQAGVLKGKFGYMSPEQVRGLEIDHRSDIFAVGVLLYEMLTGERLFVGESDFSTLERVRNAEVTPPTVYNKKITRELEHLVLKALAREVEDRFQWASDLAEELQRYLIEDRSIYSAKKLAAYMRDSYAAEIAQEQAKLEEHMRATAPLPDAEGAPAEGPEKTFVFEAAQVADAAGLEPSVTDAGSGRGPKIPSGPHVVETGEIVAPPPPPEDMGEEPSTDPSQAQPDMDDLVGSEEERDARTWLSPMPEPESRSAAPASKPKSQVAVGPGKTERARTGQAKQLDRAPGAVSNPGMASPVAGKGDGGGRNTGPQFKLKPAATKPVALTGGAPSNGARMSGIRPALNSGKTEGVAGAGRDPKRQPAPAPQTAELLEGDEEAVERAAQAPTAMFTKPPPKLRDDDDDDASLGGEMVDAGLLETGEMDQVPRPAAGKEKPAGGKPKSGKAVVAKEKTPPPGKGASSRKVVPASGGLAGFLAARKLHVVVGGGAALVVGLLTLVVTLALRGPSTGTVQLVAKDSVKPPPGVVIAVGGRKQAAELPLTIGNLAPGEHKVSVSGPGIINYETAFNVVAGQTHVVPVEFLLVDDSPPPKAPEEDKGTEVEKPEEGKCKPQDKKCQAQKVAAEKAERERKAAEDRKAAEEKKAEERRAAEERKAEERRQAEEKKAGDRRAAEEKKAADQKRAEEEKAERERKAAEAKKAAADKRPADEKTPEKGSDDKKAAQDKAAADKKAADKKAADEKAAADKKAAEEKKAADKKATDEKAAADKKAAEEKKAADKKAVEEKKAAEPPKKEVKAGQPAELICNTKPAAQVFVNGKDSGLKTPIPDAKALKLTSGKHVLMFQTAEGAKFKYEVILEPGKNKLIILELGKDPKPGSCQAKPL
jgi:serine/threonine protein kinase